MIFKLNLGNQSILFLEKGTLFTCANEPLGIKLNGV
jgi:hypothetical protein